MLKKYILSIQKPVMDISLQKTIRNILKKSIKKIENKYNYKL